MAKTVVEQQTHVAQSSPKEPIEKLIMGHPTNRYLLIVTCIRRFRELWRKNEEKKNIQELMYQSIEEVFSGEVPVKDTEKHAKGE